jgi:hypothetical protein
VTVELRTETNELASAELNWSPSPRVWEGITSLLLTEEAAGVGCGALGSLFIVFFKGIIIA